MQGSYTGVVYEIVARTGPVCEELCNPRGVSLQLSGASPSPALSVVVVPEEA